MESLPRLSRWTPLLLLPVAAGCTEHRTSVTVVREITEEYIAADMMAGHLGLQVRQQTPSMAVLSNGANTITVFPGQYGRAYVNGKALDKTGAAIWDDGKVFVRKELEEPIRAALRPAEPRPRTVEPPRPPPTGRRMTGVIVVDAGHGGKDPGAQGLSGIPEKTIVLSIARQLATLLSQRGARVVMTRSSDTFIELDDRAAIAERNRADLFVAIHADSSQKRDVSGLTFYVARGASGESTRAAQRIEAAFEKAGFESRGIHGANFRVIADHNRPAVLVETGFLTNTRDARQLADSAYRDRIARILADAITDLFAK
jgi:N-acetylmuramoyl-L-alanine amidase